ncbi:MAG: de-polymerase domain protein [Phenylobacterium sp.]|nr:de-polymerase domain protein [Phenylobacterium sp.]
MTKHVPIDPAELAAPMFWPIAAAQALFDAEFGLAARNLRFLAEEAKLAATPPAPFATANTVRLDLRTLILRDYSGGETAGLPTLIDAPYAGHSAVIADYADGQSLVQMLKANGASKVLLTDWKSATPDMKDLEVDQYLAEINVCVDELGGRVNLVGLCQGGWMAAMFAARFPQKVASLVLAGSPIDADAGEGPIKTLAKETSLATYEQLVTEGGGLMPGRSCWPAGRACIPRNSMCKSTSISTSTWTIRPTSRRPRSSRAGMRTLSTCPAAGTSRSSGRSSRKTF